MEERESGERKVETRAGGALTHSPLLPGRSPWATARDLADGLMQNSSISIKAS